ncbi:hypothetical protein GHK86_04060 [Acidimicrobiaceae bacterium USS-CC1]|uniref:Uncharacterized protein n=1 Tax=Acidiferrimicrobium australe TaxID=2664430 RepID=A0ABW9QRB4_9ACTN|nr:hypothetical protein [Acidiferrimicrobium australe]
MAVRLDTIPADRPEHADQEVATIVGRLVARALRVADRPDPADIAVLLCDAHQIAARLPIFDTRLLDAIAAQLPTFPVPQPIHRSTNPKEPITMTTTTDPTYAELLEEVRTLRGLLADRLTAVEDRLDALEAWRRQPIFDTLRAREIIVRDIGGTATGRLYAEPNAARLTLDGGCAEIALVAEDDTPDVPVDPEAPRPDIWLGATRGHAGINVNGDLEYDGPTATMQVFVSRGVEPDPDFLHRAEMAVTTYGSGWQRAALVEGGERAADDE